MSSRPSGLKGKVALVTGGSQGIGLATAAVLIRAGCRVMLAARRDDRLKEAIARLDARDMVSHVQTDVGELDHAEKAVARTKATFGGLDILINAHGILPPECSFLETTDDLWEKVIRTNLRGVINTSRAAGRSMRVAGGGVIINVSSINATLAEPKTSTYNVSKGALAALTRSVAYDLGRYGIRVVGIEPGWVRTAMTERRLAPTEGKWLDCSMLGRYGEPDEIASVIAFLAGSGASYITGTMITVDGGNSAIMPPLRVAQSRQP